MSRKPRAAKARASASVETGMPPAWPSVWMRATSTHLCVLTCGRSDAPKLFMRADIRSALRRTRPTSSRSEGVLIVCKSVFIGDADEYNIHEAFKLRVKTLKLTGESRQ